LALGTFTGWELKNWLKSNRLYWSAVAIGLLLAFLTGAVNRCYKWLQDTLELIMTIKFSEDVIPLSDLKINPGRVVNQAKETHRPILLTNRGRGVAVVQDLDEYEKNQEELAFVKAIAQGLMDIKEGNTLSLAEAKKRLGIE
jgi:prevent-host-death family protein